MKKWIDNLTPPRPKKDDNTKPARFTAKDALDLSNDAIAVNASKEFGKILRKIQQEAKFGMKSVTHAITTVTTAQYDEFVAIEHELEDRGFKVTDDFEAKIGQPYFCGNHRLCIEWR